MTRTDKLWTALARPVDAAWLAAFRVLFGGAMAISMYRFIANGWIDRFFGEPRFFFKYWGFAWVPQLPTSAVELMFWGMTGLAICTALGLCFRVASLGLALGLSYVQLLDVTIYLNHYYLAALLCWLLALSPANQVASVDAWISQRRSQWSEARPSQVSAAWLYLFRFQIGLVYFFAGVAKAQPDWLLHAQPLRIWLGANTELPLLGPLFTLPGVPLAMSWCGFLYDLTIVGWLSWRRTRPFAYAVVLCFHTLTRLLFPIGMFPVIMTVGALVFFDPSWPRTLASWILRQWRRWRPAVSVASAAEPARGHLRASASGRGALTATAERSQLPSRWWRFGWSVAALYCAFQFLLPLRTFAYGGNVLWHEQGMRFSWRVMVRAKGGDTEFVVTNPRSGTVWHVNPAHYLTGMQESEMSSQPDLILQFAQFLRSDFDARGLGPVEVRARTLTSLNGRRATPLVDPTLDLASVRDGLLPARFITAGPNEAPPETRPVL